jgi:hypothetical protein
MAKKSDNMAYTKAETETYSGKKIKVTIEFEKDALAGASRDDKVILQIIRKYIEPQLSSFAGCLSSVLDGEEKTLDRLEILSEHLQKAVREMEEESLPSFTGSPENLN